MLSEERKPWRSRGLRGSSPRRGLPMKCCGPRPPGFVLSTKRWPCDGGAPFSPSLLLPTFRREPVPSDNEETWGGRVPRVFGLLEARRWPEGSSALGVRAAAFVKLQRDGLKERKKERQRRPLSPPKARGKGGAVRCKEGGHFPRSVSPDVGPTDSHPTRQKQSGVFVDTTRGGYTSLSFFLSY